MIGRTCLLSVSWPFPAAGAPVTRSQRCGWWQVTQAFPKAANSTSFKWKDYCPLVFHNLREAFSIDNRDYLLSLTGDQYAPSPRAHCLTPPFMRRA